MTGKIFEISIVENNQSSCKKFLSISFFITACYLAVEFSKSEESMQYD